MEAAVSWAQPTPSDFSEYVYCGAKWAIKKNSFLDLNQKPQQLIFKSKRSAERYRDLLLGQKNEGKCLEWVLKETYTSPTQVVYNGTGENNNNSLTSKIKSLDISIQCKPDLIVKKDNKNILYEFKAVSDFSYLLLTEFDSYHAQVWCYTTLENMLIDKYNLVRYYIDPFIHPLTEIKQLTTIELDQTKFEKLFELYINAVKKVKEMDLQLRKGIKPRMLNLDLFNKPKNKDEIKLKCSHCRYNRDVCKMDI